MVTGSKETTNLSELKKKRTNCWRSATAEWRWRRDGMRTRTASSHGAGQRRVSRRWWAAFFTHSALQGHHVCTRCLNCHPAILPALHLTSTVTFLTASFYLYPDFSRASQIQQAPKSNSTSQNVVFFQYSPSQKVAPSYTKQKPTDNR